MKKTFLQPMLGLSLLIILTFSACDYLRFLEFNVPSAATAGQNISISYKLKNISQVETTYYTPSHPNYWKIVFYLSKDKYISPNDIPLGEDLGNILAPGDVQSNTRNLLIPSSVRSGKYFIIAGTRLVDDFDTDAVHSNTTFSPIYIQGQSNLGKDLSAINVFPYERTFSQINETLYSGDELNLYWTAYNAGLSNSNAFITEYYLSRFPVYNAATVTYLGNRISAGLNAQEKKEVEENFILDDNLEAGKYYLFIYVDALGNNSEYDEANNIVRTNELTIYKKLPDLSINSVNAPLTLDPHQSFIASTRIRNIGKKSTGNFKIEYALLKDQQVVDDQSFNLGSLAEGGSTFFQPNLSFSFSENGLYELRIRLDPDQEINELTTHNNNFSAFICVHSGSALTKEQILQRYLGNAKNKELTHLVSESEEVSTMFIKNWVKNRLMVYPNPTSDQANYQLTTTQMEKVSVTLYDLSGKVIINLHEVWGQGDNYGSLDLKYLPSGTYVLKITTQDNVFTEKIVLN